MRQFARRLGYALSLAGGMICAVLHLATFVTIVPLVFSVLPFIPLAGAAVSGQVVKSEWVRATPDRNWKLSCLALFTYAAMTFVYWYYITEGASSVDIVDGHYVSMYKGAIIRTITEQEYRMFPNLWVRVMSAGMGTMAAAYMMQFAAMLKAADVAKLSKVTVADP
jgi:hypothetical protein